MTLWVYLIVNEKTYDKRIKTSKLIQYVLLFKNYIMEDKHNLHIVVQLLAPYWHLFCQHIKWKIRTLSAF